MRNADGNVASPHPSGNRYNGFEQALALCRLDAANPQWNVGLHVLKPVIRFNVGPSPPSNPTMTIV